MNAGNGGAFRASCYCKTPIVMNSFFHRTHPTVLAAGLYAIIFAIALVVYLVRF